MRRNPRPHPGARRRPRLADMAVLRRSGLVLAPSDGILDVAQDPLGVALDLLGLAVGLLFLVAGHLAERFLEFALGRADCALVC